jgi:formamidopyrimidine-DNA glycosylase|uniref:DNA-formamidopyrimidine glycosylase n=1 Tax=Thermomicrobium roseum TaxID=500 RepID=A0A7C1K137_THERO
MPELPEVEAARRGIAEQLVGRTCTGYELFRPRLIVAPPGLTLDAIVGHPLEAVGRWGKYLWLVFPPCALLVHLKLTGQLVARGSSIPGFAAGHPVPPYDAPLPHKSTALRIDFAPDAHLYLTDVRHFARVQLLPPTELPATLRALRLGPDALSPDFTLDTFRATLARRRGIRLKAALLDQRTVAGLGNIYVDESLWVAQLHPERPVMTLTDEEITRLYWAIHEVLKIAVPLGGAKILNGRAVPPVGEFPYVHGRAGQPCVRCGTIILKRTVAGRGTYFCPRCQAASKPTAEPSPELSVRAAS